MALTLRMSYALETFRIRITKIKCVVFKVCQDLKDPTVRKNDSEITLFSAFKPMLGQRAAIDEVRY
jgi:hypothetical protein